MARQISGRCPTSLTTRVAGRFFRRFCRAIATGYIFMFFAERVFWAHWRDGEDSVGALVVTWIVYAIGAEICLIAVQDFRVRDLWSMFLVGALLGWLVEGVFTMTFFGAGDMPFPYTIVWTGLAWHALIVVVIGWYGLRIALSHSFRRTLLVSGGLGLFWGGWSIFWDIKSPPGSEAAFVSHAFISTLALIVAFRASLVLHAGRVPSSRIEKAILAAIVLAWFLGVTVARFNWIALVTLLPLFALIFLALRRNAAVETRPDFLTATDREFPWRHALAIFLMPALASVIHAGCRATGLSAETNIVVFAISSPLGAAGFLVSLWKVFRRPEDASSAAR